jgi:two-component system chemotaxis response regulator CheB
MSGTEPVRVLVADDSPTMRRALALLFTEEPRIQLVGEARDGAEAMRLCAQLRPDVVTMDVDMPVVDGLAATERIMDETPTRVLVVCAVAEARALDLSFRAIAAGALEMIAKPAAPIAESDFLQGARLRKFGREVVRSILLMAEVPVVRRRTFSAARPGDLAASRHRIDVLGIAASTGGPPALAALLGTLPTDLPVSILVAQHIAHGFGDGLLHWLQRSCPLAVRRAAPGERCAPGTVYLAPDGCDLQLGQNLCLLTPASNGPHCPSADALFRSLAESLGPRAAGFVLSGMGDDGAQGLLAMRRAGAPCYAQDAQSSAVFGMPQAALDAGAVQELLSLERMARLIVELS